MRNLRFGWPLRVTAVFVIGWMSFVQSAFSESGPAAAAGPSAGTADELVEVTVTATRIVRSGFTAPTPETSIDSSQIAASAAANVADVLNQIPAFRPTNTSTSVDTRTFAPGANYADLRGFGSIRTLVLVNDERVVPEVPAYSGPITNQVDLNIFPTIAIQRVDVVTGGASAAWGSDAIAGVVNLVLFKHYQGFQAEVSGGESQQGDNRDLHLAFLTGTSFSDGRGNITVATEFDRNEGIGDVYTRDWGKVGPLTIQNIRGCRATSVDCYIRGNGYQNATAAPGGLITSGPLRGTTFGPGGDPYTFNYGLVPNNGTSNAMFGGGVPGNTQQAGYYMKPPVERGNLYVFSDYAFTDSLTGHVQVDYAQSSTRELGNPYTPSFNINSGNPFIPASVQAAMTADGLASIPVGVYDNDLRLREQVTDKTSRATVGLDWDIGQGWSANAYYEYGTNRDDQQFSSAVITANAAQAVNAVTSASTGQIVCANPTNGCVPLNIFGTGSASAAANAYITGNPFVHVRYDQQVVAGNLRGDPFNTWAGVVSIAAGAEYRQETQTDVVDAAQAAGAYAGMAMDALQNPDFHGKLHVSEVYEETVIPLVKALPLVKELDLNGAIRFTDYSTVGSATTWKVGLTWDVTDDLLLRGTRSRDFRAPNLTELNYPSTEVIVQPIPGQAQGAPVYQGGNPNLKPEVAKTITAGFTYSPSFIQGLHASVDYFDINLSNAITIVNGGLIYNECALGLATYCALETKANGMITGFNSDYDNLSNVLTRGVDAEFSYATPLSSIVANLPGSMTWRLLGTYTIDEKYQVGPGLPVYNHAGQIDEGLLNNAPFYLPRFRGMLSANYKVASFTSTLQMHFIAAGVQDTTLSTSQFSANNVPSNLTFDLLGGYSFGDGNHFQVFGAINNLLDKYPPIVGLSNTPTSALYDVVGRTYTLGLRVKY